MSHPMNLKTSPPPFARAFFLIGLVTTLCSAQIPAQNKDLAWPAISRVQKPWAYWWWLGSAVDEKNIKKDRTRYRDAGMGGVHIIPICGAKGCETNYITYLSPRWMEILGCTVREANRLDLGVDM